MLRLNIFLPLFFLILSLLLSMPKLSATHFMGVEVSYQCLPSTNNCVFRIFHSTYYDCAGAATTALPGPPFPPYLQYLRSPQAIWRQASMSMNYRGHIPFMGK